MKGNPTRFYYKQNRLKQLRAFCYAADTGSISRAAERMFLSQPSVSLIIKALENELDTLLFRRNGPRIRLTPEGRILQELASPLVDGMDTLPEIFAERCNKTVGGELHIAAGESSILYILPDIVKEFTGRYPELLFRLHNVTGRDGLALLRAGEVDLAINSMVEVPDDISYHPFYSYDPMLITPPGHPLVDKAALTLEDIAEYGLILPPAHLNSWHVIDLVFTQNKLKYEVSMEAGGWEVIKEYVRRGLGISIVTSICLTEADNLSAIPLNRYFPKRTYGLILRKGKQLTPAASRFVDIMKPDFLQNPQSHN